MDMAGELALRARSSSVHQGHIPEFEREEGEPSLLVRLACARLRATSTDVLIDDKVDLPGT